jgi:serine/threonine-protein kinase
VIGETIGNFRMVSRLGRGGMGDVYLGEQQSIGTRVAVKVLHAQISADEEHVKRFFNEARAVQRIQHAGITKIFDVGFHASGHAYLVMEYLEGESLATRIKRSGKLHPAEIAELGKQIASVLDATHGAGITHRDLKPDNIFIVADRELASRQRVKILDFGIAKLSGTLAAVSPVTHGTMGTPAYMAPEQWGDTSKVDARADLYSLGCVVFEMATGRPPFNVTTLAEACGKHLTEVPSRARSLLPSLPQELDDLLAQLLEKKVENRPQSGDEVARRFGALSDKLGPAPVTTLPPVSGNDATMIAPLAGTEPTLAAGTPSKLVSPTASTVAASTPAPTVRAKPAAKPAAPPAPTRRRWPLLVAALVLAGGGAAAAIVVMGRMTKPEKPAPVAAAPPVDAMVIDAAMPDAQAIDATTDAAPVEIDAAVVPDEPEPTVAEPDPGTFGAAFRAAKSDLEACIRVPGTVGNARVRIGADGRVGKAVITGFTPRENACLANVVRALRFTRKANGPSFTVNVTIPPDAKR